MKSSGSTWCSVNPAASSCSAISPSCAQRELARGRRVRALHQPARDQLARRQRAPRVLLGGGPRGERDAAAGLEHAPRLAQRVLGVGHQHVAPAAQDAVDARGLEVDARVGVDLLEAHVADAELLGAALGGLQHLGREVRARSACRRARSARRRAARCRRCRRPARAASARAAGRSRRSATPRPASWRCAAGRGATPNPRPARPSACGSARGSRRGPPRRPATLAQVGAADLARLGARQLVDELERLRDLERRRAARGSARAARLRASPAPGRATTSAVIASPQSGCGRANTAASTTSGCSASAASTSAGETFSPPVMITSPLRPVTISRPCSSSRPRSPVRRLPSVLTVAAGDDDLAVVGDRHADAGQRAARRSRRRPARRP